MRYVVVANRTAKGSIFRISVFFAEIKAPSGRGERRLRSLITITPVHLNGAPRFT